MILVLLCAAGLAAPAQADALPAAWTVPVDDAPVATGPWWSAFADPDLESAVERALAANPDLKAAQARAGQARGARLVALSPLLPGVSASASTSAQPLDAVFRCNVGAIDPSEFAALGQPGTGTGTGTGVGDDDAASLCWQGSALVNLGWNIDLFGRDALGHRAAAYEARAAEGDAEALGLVVSATVVSAYLDVVSAREQVAILERQQAAQQDLLTVLELRYEHGSASGLDVLQQRQALAGTQAAVPTARAAADSQARALATLLASTPDTVSVATGLPVPTPLPAIGQPAELVRRRPDLRAAQHRSVAARARHASSVRTLLPSVAVSANAGWNYAVSDEWSTIDVWGFGGSVTVPVFNGGRLAGSIQQAAQAEVAALNAFDGALRNAVRDVENAVLLDQAQGDRHRAIDRQLEAAQQAYEEARERYLTGVDGFINVLAAQASLQAAELTQVQAHRDRLAARVQLWTALGGSTASGVSP